MTRKTIVVNNADAREVLARKVVDSWDQDTLIGEMVNRLEQDYKHDDDLFQEDWEVMDDG